MLKFEPSKRLLNKLVMIYSIIAGLILVFAFAIGGLMSLDEPSKGVIFSTIFTGIAVFFWLITFVLSGPYTRSLKYEIRDDEIIVHVGIITKSVKHVPFRTVTNIKINRGLLDRYVFNMGTLNIQTAGMSGSTGAEESLVGLENVEEIYNIVATELRKFRGAMSPTGSEDIVAVSGDGTLIEILGELREIRKSLAK
jgi:membrane protein YdbS with pleckstrin-like domain